MRVFLQLSYLWDGRSRDHAYDVGQSAKNMRYASARASEVSHHAALRLGSGVV